MRVRTARPDDRTAVRGVLDAGLLETAGVDAAVADGRALVAVADDRVLGALVTEATRPTRVTGVAVRPGRRGQGIGTALVAAAADRWAPLVAEFDERVRPFYEALGFDVERRGDRYRGVLRESVM